MYLITNRHATKNSGPLTILQPKPNTSDPYMVSVYEVVRRPDQSWWLERRFTLDTTHLPPTPHSLSQHNKYTQLTEVFLHATKALLPKIDTNKPVVYVFSKNNADPQYSFERAERLEKNDKVTALTFSFPIEHSHHALEHMKAIKNASA